MTTPSPLMPAGLRCAHLTDPLGVSPDRVRFSWLLTGPGSDGRQTGFQVRVFLNDARQPSSETLVWDSGRVASGESADTGYGGPALAAGGRYAWQVRVWDAGGLASDWSPAARFEVELDRTRGWRGSWIGLGPLRESFTPPAQDGSFDAVANALQPAPYLRRSFSVGKQVASARLYVTALGLYEARLNGQRVGDAYLAPGWTDYAKRVLYQTYNVTSLLAPGQNVLGAIIADGWYAGYVGFDAKRAGAHYGAAPELLAQLVIAFADGSQEWIVTDEQWQGRSGAIRHADLLMGERHDLRMEPRGWDTPGYGAVGSEAAGSAAAGSGAGGWRAVQCRPLDDRPLIADPGPPVRVTEEILPVGVATDDQGRRIVDFGQNLSGWVKITCDGPAGTTVRVRHAEVLSPGGGLYTENLRTARQADEYILGGGAAVLEPRFTIHGFRYAEISGYPGDLDPADVVARVAHSDTPVTGSFSCSQGWLDQLFRNIDWGQRGNFISVPTDCPQRDERLGWLGDAQIFARTACYNRDVAAFFGKWLDDVADAQLPSGAFTDIAPRLHLPWAGAPAWGDAGVIVPWTVWKMYGDTGILRRHLGAMTAWMDYIERANPDYLRARDFGNSYNDWLAPGEDDTPPELLGTAYWAHDAALMAEIADAAGRPDDAAGYRALRAKIGTAFTGAFVTNDGRITSGTQTAYVLGLHMGLIPDELRAAAAGHLVAAIKEADWHLTTGFVGVGYLLPVLSSTGHTAVAYRLLAQRTEPSWRYMIDNGATTVWERWDGWTASRGFQSAWMNSFNHYALGSVGEWLYRYVLGIDQEPGTAGFTRLLLRPHPGAPLSWARGSYQSARGAIAAGWERTGDRLEYRVSVPPNVTAAVCVPGADQKVYHVGHGTHSFTGVLAEEEHGA